MLKICKQILMVIRSKNKIYLSISKKKNKIIIIQNILQKIIYI